MSTQIKTVKQSNNRAKRIVSLILMAVFIIGLLIAAYIIVNTRQEEVSVIRLKYALKSGDIVTEECMEEYPMLKNTYDTLGKVTKHDANGNPYLEQVIIAWKNREKIYGKYLTNFLRQGDYITTMDITDEVTLRNPWIADMTNEQEVYTMSFSTSDINTRIIYPGTRLRVRLVKEVPISMAETVRAKINSQTGETNIRQSILLTTNFEEPDKADAKTTTTVQVSEVVMSSIQITDMLNGSGESIYDIYMALLKLPVTNRMKYLSTALGDSETATSFQSRVTPSSLCLVVTKDEANILAEFEKTQGASLKYTVLPDIDDSSMMMQFIEISNQIDSITKIEVDGSVD